MIKLRKLVCTFALCLSCLSISSASYAQDSEQILQQMWDLVKGSRNADFISDFRTQFPDSKFEAEAIALLQELEGGAVVERAPVTFSAPLSGFGEDVDGRSLAAYLSSSPAFSPIEGLPDEVWKGKVCADCHAWKQADLCNQSKHYLKPAGAQRLELQHPLGHNFKQAMKAWAENDCS